MTWRRFLVLLAGLGELADMAEGSPAGPAANGYIDDPVESERQVAAMFGRGRG